MPSNKKQTYNKNRKSFTKSPGKKNGKPKFRVAPQKIKAQKLAKKMVKNEYKDTIGTMDPAKLKELHAIAVKAINKERMALQQKKIHSGLANVQLTSPYKPLKATVLLDFGSMDVFVRALLEVLSMEYPFLNVINQGCSPYQFRFYCWTLVVAYIKKVGKLTGPLSNQVPNLLPTFRIPNALAKFMEYLGPASKNGAQQTTEFNFDVDLQAVSTGVGYGDGLQQISATGVASDAGYTGSQLNFIMEMSAVAVVLPQPTPAIPVNQPTFVYQALTPPAPPAINPYLWSNWMAAPGNMDLVSNALERFKIPTVDASWLPGAFAKQGRAPDSSSYSFFNQEQPLVTGPYQTTVPVGASWLNVHTDFDEDLAFVFRLSSVATTTPAVAAKPLPLPLFDYNARYATTSLPNPMPWYIQPHYVAIFLANHCDTLKRGHWKDLTIKGGRLSSLFPNVRVIGGTSFSTLAVHCYQQMQIIAKNDNSKTTAGVTTTGFLNDNNLLWNWWVLWTAAVQSAQRKFNEQQVVPMNSPIFTNTDPAVPFLSLPQYNWVDSACSEIQLPPPLAKAVEDLGCCIYKGRLMIPQNNLTTVTGAMTYPLGVNQQYGPMGVSANGWGAGQLDIFPYENLMTPATYQTTPATPLNVQLDDIIINNGLTTIYMGYDGGNSTLYPAFLGGQWTQAYDKLLTAFYMSGNSVNTIEKNMEAPVNDVLGSDSALMQENEPNFNAAQQTPVVPDNLDTVQGGSLNLYADRVPTVAATHQKLGDEPGALRAAANGWVQSRNQPGSNSDTMCRRSVLIIKQLATGAALTNTDAEIPSGAYNFAFKAGNSITGVLAALCHNTIKPDSTFGKQKALIDEARNSFGQLIPASKKAIMQKLTTSKAYNSELAKLSGSAFGITNRVPQVTPESIGHNVAKGMSAAAASTLAVIDSSSQITASNATAPQDSQDPKHKRQKLDGKRIKSISKALIGTTKKVASGIDDAVKKVSHIADVAGKGVETLGSILI